MTSPVRRGGIGVVRSESQIVSRAREFLAAGPADAVTLVSAVCQLSGVPATVAEHMAGTLLSGSDDFVRDADGRWRLRASGDARLPDAHLSDARLHDARESPARLLDERFVVVDVETTGVRPDAGDRVTEIAAVIVEGGEVGEVYSTLINPQRAIPPWITNLTNISWDMVKDAPIFPDVCDRVTSFMDGRVFVAHNAPFDWRFMDAEVHRATGQRLEGRQLCTVRLARRILPQLHRRSLDMVAHHYGVEIAARHRAAGDAVATAHVLLRLLEDAADRGVESWESMDEFLAPSTTTRRRRGRRSAMPSPSTGGEGV